MGRHRKQEWEFLRNQLDEQRDALKRHMVILQAAQMKQLEAKHDRECKEMISQQAKVSVEIAKEVCCSLFGSGFLMFVFFRLPMIKI